MAVETQVDLLHALEQGDYQSILGTAESEEIDFKEAPYPLDSPRQKWELAKDVAAFANTRGGLIVIGFRTQRAEMLLVDTATRHTPVPKARILWDQYRQTIGRWVHPPVTGITPRWFPPDAAQDHGVFVIVVPAQDESSKYFVVSEMVRDDGSFPGAVGIPHRQGDVIVWSKPEAVHSLLREALWWRRQGPGIPQMISSRGEQAFEDEERLVVARCRLIEEWAGWTGAVPFCALHAVPQGDDARPDDFYSDDGMKAQLESPSILRREGFNILTGGHTEVLPDGSLARGTDRRILWLSTAGFLSAAGRADDDFLGWYVNEGRRADQSIALNPRVAAEFVLEFCRFVHSELTPRWQDPWHLWLSLVGLDRSGGVVLAPALAHGGDLARHWRGIHESHGPLTPEAHRRVVSGASSGGDAYRLMVELYAQFAQPPNSIPFVADAEISEGLLLDAMQRR
jgi:hypothetical protein